MIAHRAATLVHLAKARTKGDQSIIRGYEDVVLGWNQLLAHYGVEPIDGWPPAPSKPSASGRKMPPFEPGATGLAPT
jgi:hypothetical protein